MTTLEDAWNWYQAVSAGAKRLDHLSKHWDMMPWGEEDEWIKRIQKDNVLRHVEAEHLAEGAKRIEDDLEDLAVLMLFSVFEAIVRDVVEKQIRPEVDQLKHVALKFAGQDVLQAVAEGSFFRVLDPYKSPANSDLVEQVNQVRRYRNWVAHGRRPDNRPNAVIQPKEAYQRLNALLAVIRPPEPGAEALPASTSGL